MLFLHQSANGKRLSHGLNRIGHQGVYAGFRSSLQYYPDQRFGVAVLSNLSSFTPDLVASEISGIFLREFMAPEHHVQAKPYGIEPSALNRYVGHYQIEKSFVIISIHLEDRRLMVTHPNYTKRALTPVSNTEFYADTTGDRFSFQIDSDGKVTAFTSCFLGRQHKADALKYIPDGDLSQYEGCYYSQELETFYSIRLKSEGLRAVHQRNDDVGLAPIADDLFACDPWWFGRMEFLRNDEGKIKGFCLTSE